MTATSLLELVERSHVLVCCGTGGVGKTTTAAALALGGARRGRRVAVITIDPARRLADTLGLTTTDDHDIPRSLWDPDGAAPGSGRLTAMMLDTSKTFDGLVARYAASDEQRDRILENRFYRNLASALSGTQEYMAMERLHELHETGAYDLIVVDTPPTRHALDFLDAPQRLIRLLDNRVFHLMMMPARGAFRVATAALHVFVRQVGRVVGTAVVDDIIAFFRAFEGMEEGFRARADGVRQLLAEESTGFVLVTSPRQDSIDEARYFADQIAAHGLTISALVANRVHPAFAPESEIDRLRARAADLRRSATVGADAAAAARRLADRYDTLADLAVLAARERRVLADVAERMGPSSLAYVPFLEHDVHDLPTLLEIGRHLLGGGPTHPSGSDAPVCAH
jgi:anion-transporting  ArsA/GET3 family ATPase